MKIRQHLIPAVLFLLCLLLPAAAARPAYADTPEPSCVAYGACGNDAVWTVLDIGGTRTLLITGSGAIPNYSYQSMPWYRYQPGVRSVIVSDGITEVGSYAFFNHFAVRSVTLGNSVTRLGAHAFDGCISLLEFTVGNQVKTLEVSSLATGGKIRFLGTNREWIACGGDHALGGSSVEFAYTEPFDLAEATIRMGTRTLTYTGKPQTASVTVFFENRMLLENADYTLSYENNTDAGAATVTASGMGDYTGSVSASFQIEPLAIGRATVSSVPQQTYSGKKLTPVPEVTYYLGGGRVTLREGKDFTCRYENNKDAGTATVFIDGTGNYSGTVFKTFRIGSISLEKAAVSGIKDQVFTGSEKKPAVTLKLKLGGSTVTLKQGTDYRVSYYSNRHAGTGRFTVVGQGNYSGVLTGTFTIKAKSLKTAEISGIKTQSFDGNPVKPKPGSVKLTIGKSKVTLQEYRDYTVSYKNNKKAGTATIVITGKGDYTGKATATFKIEKGTPDISFAEKNMTAGDAAGSITNKLNTPSEGKLTYSSSNTKVATVDSKGKVTVKSTGRTTISVSQAASSDFKAGKASYTLMVIHSPAWKDLHFSFYNSPYDMGYPDPYYIPYERYQYLYGKDGDKAYQFYKGLAWGGSCFGMSTGSGLLGREENGISAAQFKSSAARPSALSIGNRSSRYGLSVRDFIETMQISWNTRVMVFARREYNKDLNGMVQMLKKEFAAGNPVVISIYKNGGGHAVIGYELQKYSSTKTRLYIYDPNFANEKRFITLTRNGDDYVSWYYKVNDIEPFGTNYGVAEIYCDRQESILNAWNNRGNNSFPYSVRTNAASYEVQDTAGTVLARVADGELTSDSGDISLLPPAPDTAGGDRSLVLPEGDYRIVNHEEGLETLQIMTCEGTISVQTGSDQISALVSADASAETVTVDAEKGENYKVVFTSSSLQEKGVEEVAFVGVTNGAPLTVGLDNGAYVVENCDEMKIVVDGIVVEERIPGQTPDPNHDEPESSGN